MRRRRDKVRNGRGVFSRQRRAEETRARLGRYSVEWLEERRLLASDVIVSEFLAVNLANQADQDGEFSDWIELKNVSVSSVNLAGWYLTDDEEALTKWRFPSTVVAPGQSLLVFASGKDRATAGSELHTNFQLSGSGEDLLLVRPDGTSVADGFRDYPAQLPGISYGIPNSAATFTRLLSTGEPVKYRVPTVAHAGDNWTAIGYDDQTWIDTAPLAAASLVISEVVTDEAESVVEVQNVSGQAVNTTAWQVWANDAAAGVSGVHSVPWLLPSSVPAGGVLFRSDLPGLNSWGTDLNWTLDGAGWVTILNAQGQVVDMVAWGYGVEQLAGLQVDLGNWLDVPIGARWQGASAGRGSTTLAQNFVAYNDHAPGPGTGANVTTYAANGVASGSLRDVSTGTSLAATLTASHSGAVFQTNGASPAAGTDAHQIFNTFVDFASAAGNSVEVAGAATHTQTFSNLDTGDSIVYEFAGSALRGNAGYTDRWVKVRLLGAESATPMHSNGRGVVVISPTEAALWVGDNSAADQGYVVQWTGIDPGVDGVFAVESSQYTGTTPGVGTGSAASGGKGYALTGIRLTAQGPGEKLRTLRRVGNRDHDTSADFVRVTGDSRGLTNPNLTQPFATTVPAVTGLGYAPSGSPLSAAIATDVGSALQGANSSLWARMEFDVTDASRWDDLRLFLKYDDAVVVWINGVEVARDNAPEELGWNSAAQGPRTDSLAAMFAEFDISEYLDALVPGRNVLAIQLLNQNAGDVDVLLVPELTAGSRLPQPQYMTRPTPRQENVAGVLGRVADTKFSVDRGFYTTPFDLVISTATPGAEIRYTLNGSRPTASNGLVYSGPIRVANTTTLRAAAFLPGYLPTEIDTQTYIFVEDVLQQTFQSTIAAGFPSTWNGTAPDYGLDSDVIGPADLFNGKYAARIRDALQAIPSVSFTLNVNDMFGPSGIYSNPENSSLEVATSAELIYPDGTDGFQIDAGLKIQGGAFRGFGLTKKKSLRLKFQSQYGDPQLEYPFFGENATNEFDTITFRMESNDGWQWSGSTNRLYSRDQWGRLTQLAMGQPAAHGRYVHIYVNGHYWGMYNAVERPDETFASRYIGGDKDDWDVQNSGNPIKGNLDSWNTLRNLARAVATATAPADKTAALRRVEGLNPDGTDNPAWESYLDVDNYIDYLIVNWYGGNSDWPFKNYYAGRRRGPESKGFQFFVWDYEWTLNLQSDVNTNRLNDTSGIAEPYASLRTSPEFRLRFADRVQKHFFNGGALYVNPASPAWNPAAPENNVPASRFSQIMQTVELPLVAESARWGDQHQSRPMTVDESWRPNANGLLNYFRNRSANMLNQFRSAGLFPGVAAPVFNQHGGVVPPGFELLLTAPAGTVYYTTDGSDPRLPGGEVNPQATVVNGPITINDLTRVKARVLLDGIWSALNDVQFQTNQPAGPDSLRITELNYHPHEPWVQFGELQTGDADDYEFVELQNVSESPVELEGVRFTRGIDFMFAQQTLLPGERIVVVKNQTAFASRYGQQVRLATGFDGLAGPAGIFGGSLSNSGEGLKLVSKNGTLIQEFDYDDAGAWPGRADGNASSLEVIDVAANYSESANWRSSAAVGGTPGSGPMAVPHVVINEILANSVAPAQDAIELHNPSGQAINVSKWYLSDSNENYLKYQFAVGSSLEAGGYRVVTEADFRAGGGTNVNDFLLSSRGDDVWLLSADPVSGRPLAFVDRVEFGATLENVSLARLPNGDRQANLLPAAQATWGSANIGHRVGELVISELHYNPPGADDLPFEFIELQNTTPAPLNVSGWAIRDSVDIELPAGTMLGAGQTLVLVGFDPLGPQAAAFRQQFNVPAAVRLIGPWAATDALDNGGETISLERALPPQLGENGPVYVLIDQLKYDDQSPWPTTADGDGQSLHRQNFAAFGNAATSWQAAAPTPGSVPAAVTPRVVGRHVFYNSSQFDGQSDASNAADDAAIATDKTAYRIGSGAATYANLTNFVAGLNGIMVDIANLPAANGGAASLINAEDFGLRMSLPGSSTSWTAAPTPSSITVRRGAGVDGSDRVTLIWPAGTIRNRWLEITVKPTAATGLTQLDTFYFGNAVGETGRSAGNWSVDGSDYAAVRDNFRSAGNPAAVDSAFDMNRDGLVDNADLTIVRQNVTNFLTRLPTLNLANAAPLPARVDAVLAEGATATGVTSPSLVSAVSESPSPLTRRRAVWRMVT